MKKVGGVILVFLGILAVIYTTILGNLLLSCVAGLILGPGIALLMMRDISVVRSEVREEDGVLRLCVTVKNNQKRATAVWFVANVFHHGMSIGVVNSNNILLTELGTGELTAVLPRPSAETKKEEITWQIVKWNFK